MKKFLSRLFILLFSFALIVPTYVFAEGEDETVREPVTVYLFRGEGCPHCAEAEEWFDSIEEEYGDYFDVQDYEVWYNKDNNELMTFVAEHMGEDLDNLGVPYMIIGEYSYSGFNSADADLLLSYIMEEYEKDPVNRTQVVPMVIEQNGWGQKEDTTVRDLIVGLVIVAVVVGLVVVIVKARKEE